MRKLRLFFYYTSSPTPDVKLSEAITGAADQSGALAICIPKTRSARGLIEYLKEIDALCCIFRVPRKDTVKKLSALYEENGILNRVAYEILGCELVYMRLASYEWLTGDIQPTKQDHEELDSKTTKERKKIAKYLRDRDVDVNEIAELFDMSSTRVYEWTRVS